MLTSPSEPTWPSRHASTATHRTRDLRGCTGNAPRTDVPFVALLPQHTCTGELRTSNGDDLAPSRRALSSSAPGRRLQVATRAPCIEPFPPFAEPLARPRSSPGQLFLAKAKIASQSMAT